MRVITIYVVRPGDTLWAIAQSQGVPLDTLIAANALPDPNQLVVGQAIIIPSRPVPRTYTVRPGDTLYAIARRFGTTVSALVAANRIVNPNLIYPGQVLVIPTAEPPKPEVSVNGYIFPISRTRAAALFGRFGDLLTYICIFSLAVDGRGGLIPPGDITPVVTEARARGIAPLITLSNFSAEAGTFTSELARSVLANRDVRDRTIENLLGYLRGSGLVGVNVDFENMFPEDRPLYNDFIRLLTDRLRAEGLLSTIAAAPKPADFPTLPWVGAFDYATLGAIVDWLVIMTYEWGWIGGPPMAIAPANQVRRALTYAVSQIPREKILQGIPLYGYDWELPDTPENLAVHRTHQEALRIAVARGAAIEYDPVAEAPVIRYTDEAGVAHELWFEDARSLLALFALNREFGLLGISFWHLLEDWPAAWTVVRETFTVRKRLDLLGT
ncbi:MAG: LysM peptidoglycan-binding domain-containing protein [Bacillota bacterium]|nr:LysM peptidoglycan-binding domain-containing protein [Bacillota bacterium]